MTATARAPEPAAAVVVPMYGVVDYIEECLSSLEAQTMADRLQVVLVDDGSTDGTRDAAAPFVARNRGWSLVTQPNGGPGPGSARNRGLDEVRAPYVLFCDGDDVLAPEALEALVGAAGDTDADLVVGAASQFPESRTWRWSHLFDPADGAVVPVVVTDVPDLVHHPAPGDKLFRVDFLRRHDLRFGERIHHQDTLVSVPAMLLPSRVTLLRRVVQGYRRRGDGSSIMDSHFTRPENTWDHLDVVTRLAGLREGLSGERRELLDAFLVRSFQGFLARGAQLPRPDAVRLFHGARVVYGTVDPRTILEMTDGPVHALAYRAVLDGDQDAFLDPTRGARGVLPGPDGLRLDVDVPETWAPATGLGRIRARLESVAVVDGHVELAGVVWVGGAPALAVLGTPVSVRLRGAGVTVRATLRPATGADALTRSHFVARFPLQGLTAANAAVRVVVGDGEHQRSGRVAAVPSATGCHRTRTGLLVSAAADAEGAAVVSVGPEA